MEMFRSYRSLSWLRFCLIAFSLAQFGGSAHAQTRHSVPTAEKQKEFAKLLEDGYDLPRLDNTAKKQDALAKLMESLADENLGADERYVVLATAISLASQTGDADEWLKAANALVETFDVDATKEKTRLLTEFLKASKPNAQVKPIVEEAIEMSQAAAKEHQFSEALALLGSVDTVLRRAADGATLKPLVTEARSTITAREKEWKAYQAAKTKLESKPDDSAANLTVGRWFIVQNGDWTKALPFLIKVSDPKWKAAAELERGMPTDVMMQVAVGDAWWDIAQKENGTAKTALLVHAGEWYQLAIPNLTSALKKQVVAKRLDDIESLTTQVTPPAQVKSQPTATQGPGEWVDLLALSDGFDWTPLGNEWASNLVGKPTKQGITLQNGAYRQYPLAAIIDGDYELEAEFFRTEGNSGLGLVFPVGIHNMFLELGAADGDTFAGVGYIDGKWSNNNSTRRKTSVVANNVRHRLKIRVKTDGSQAAFQIDWDEQPNFINWKGPSDALVNINTADSALPLVQHVWVHSFNGKTTFDKVRIKMASGTVRGDAITEADRQADRKKGYIRLVGEKPTKFQVASGRPAINQLTSPLSVPEGMERRWPLIAEEFRFCNDYYAAHAPSRLKCPIPSGAKSFSVVGYNDSRRATNYLILIDGKIVHDSGQAAIAIIKVAIPSKASSIELVTKSAEIRDYDRSYWCFPRFHNVDVERITDKMLDGKPGMKFTVSASTVEKEPLLRNKPIVACHPLHFRDAVPCHEFLFAHATSVVSYDVPPGMTRFTAIGYNVVSQQVKYAVFADGASLFQSPMAGIVPIDLKLPVGTKTIELKITDEGGYDMDHSMWCYPRLHQR